MTFNPIKTTRYLKFTVVEFDPSLPREFRTIKGDYLRCDTCRWILMEWSHYDRAIYYNAWLDRLNTAMMHHMDTSPKCVFLKLDQP